MGFGREARRVRESSLPFAYRLHALGSCIQISQPIGFQATWSYLEERVGRTWRDPEFLLPALALLDEVRATHQVLEQQYAELRRSEKRRGLRFPAGDAVTPATPRRWHGDERTGARHTLRSRQGRFNDTALAQHPVGAEVVAAVDHALDSGTVAVPDLESLEQCLAWARRQLRVAGWKADPAEYRIASVVLHLVGQLHVMTYGGQPPGSTWHFVAEPV